MEVYPPTDWTKHPLHVAAMSGNKTEVERLLSQGADVNENVFLEGTPLHVAICHGPVAGGHGHAELLRLLLATPLHEAAEIGAAELAELLLSYGADINSKKEDHCRTPLHRAVAAGKEYMVEFLISKGADVNAVADLDPPEVSARYFPECGMTPLHVAARDGCIRIARRLLAAGATRNIKVAKTHGDSDAQGLTAFDLVLRARLRLEARLTDFDELVKLLDTEKYPRRA